MVALYVRMIEQGRLLIDDVPDRWRDAVIDVLNPIEYEDDEERAL